MLLAVLIVGAASFSPLFAEGGTLWPVVIIPTLMFFIVTGVILWMTFSIQYVFYQDYLFVKGGPFRSRIPYEQITKVSPTTDIFTGYRILSSRDGVEIFYKTAILGSVKISPENKKEFISEVKKRCPNIQDLK
ncbi:PH domain-containing protein [Planococcus shixiaomingii]|nr:PH domain-containing protein [Planococcus sp. N028]